MSSRTLSLILLVCSLHVVFSALRDDFVEDAVRRKQLRQAVDGAAGQLQLNLITTLQGLATTAAVHGQNATKAIHTLTRAVITNTFDLATVVGYMPRLLLLDLPTQFVEVLRLMRNQQVRVPSDVNSSIDNVVTLVRQSQESGIQENLFGPITRFLPNMLTGVNEFLVSIFDNVFGLIGGV